MRISVKLLGVFSILFSVLFSNNSETNSNAKNKSDSKLLQLAGSYLGQKPPGMKPEIFAPDIVSSKDHIENGCSFSPDRTEFYFSRQVDDVFHIFAAYFKNGEWTSPVPLLHTEANDFEPYITPDNKKLYYTRSNRNDSTFTPGIWYVERMNEGWSTPKYLSLGMYVSSAKNGNLYYSGMLSNGWISGQIEKRKFINGQLSDPVEIDSSINSPHYELHPCISQDESFIIFVSRRTDGRDAKDNFNDLYICFKSAEGIWREAGYLGGILGKSARMSPYISPDGKYLFFTQGGEIYWVDAKVIDELRF